MLKLNDYDEDGDDDADGDSHRRATCYHDSDNNRERGVCVCVCAKPVRSFRTLFSSSLIHTHRQAFGIDAFNKA